MEFGKSLEKDYNSESSPNYDEYNKNNRLVNDVNYSYYLNESQNLKNKNENENGNININNDFNENIKNTDNGMNTSRDQIFNQNNNYNTENNLNNTQNRLITPYNLTSRISSPINIKAEEKVRKKILLDNIQAQINLHQEAKYKELQKTKEEDAKYLKDMFEKYPFGRGGGGAPIRNKKGEIVTQRRNLISDYKYNKSSINVDDDFDEVMGNKKNRKNNYNSTSNVYFNYNRYTPSQKFYSTMNSNSLNNNLNTPIKLSSSYDLRKYNNDLDKAIYERKLKQLELKKVQEEIKNEELKEENNKLEYDILVHDTQKNKNLRNLKNKYNNNNYTNNTLTEENEEYETTTDNNTNNVNGNYNNDIQYFNSLDYYDNINFVPKSRINQRLDNNFLFSEELSKMRRDFETKQISLLNQISKLKDASLLAKAERNKVNKNLALIQLQLDKLRNERNFIPRENRKEENDFGDNNTDRDDVTYGGNNLYRNENDYNYIDDKFFKKYERELPYSTKMKKDKNIFHLEKNYEDRDLIELDKLIKKSDDIMENLKENELIEKKFKKKPDDYFDTSDYFFDTYMLKHKNDYIDYDNEYKNKYRNNNVKNKFIDFNDFDYEV